MDLPAREFRTFSRRTHEDSFCSIVRRAHACERLRFGLSLSAQQAADVKKFRADGETLHKAGKHQESVDTLAKAMKILGI